MIKLRIGHRKKAIIKQLGYYLKDKSEQDKSLVNLIISIYASEGLAIIKKIMENLEDKACLQESIIRHKIYMNRYYLNTPLSHVIEELRIVDEADIKQRDVNRKSILSPFILTLLLKEKIIEIGKKNEIKINERFLTLLKEIYFLIEK